jgi:hypothetical protein
VVYDGGRLLRLLEAIETRGNEPIETRGNDGRRMDKSPEANRLIRTCLAV